MIIILVFFRFIYDRSGEESSRAREIERSMRDARFRELCKVRARVRIRVRVRVKFENKVKLKY